MIKFENVGLQYSAGAEVLSNINFMLAPGSFHFLTGPSGAGKTSLLKLLYIGLKPTRGLITMFDHTLNSLEQHELSIIRRQIGVVFQDFRLLAHLSTFDNVALPLRIGGAPEAEVQSNVNALLDWVRLGAHKTDLPQTLSGGQQQRIAIARAVIARPQLLLADEPTGNLDDDIGLRLLNLFDQLNRMGTTIVFATHNQKMMEQFNHPRLMLDNGHLNIAPAHTE